MAEIKIKRHRIIATVKVLLSRRVIPSKSLIPRLINKCQQKIFSIINNIDLKCTESEHTIKIVEKESHIQIKPMIFESCDGTQSRVTTIHASPLILRTTARGIWSAFVPTDLNQYWWLCHKCWRTEKHVVCVSFYIAVVLIYTLWHIISGIGKGFNKISPQCLIPVFKLITT